MAGFRAQGSDAPAVLGKETRAMGVASPGLEQGAFPLLPCTGTQLTIRSFPAFHKEQSFHPNPRNWRGGYCRTVQTAGHKQEAKAGGKKNKVSISGLHCPHGTGMWAMSNVAGTRETPPFQQVLSFFPFLFFKQAQAYKMCFAELNWTLWHLCVGDFAPQRSCSLVQPTDAPLRAVPRVHPSNRGTSLTAEALPQTLTAHVSALGWFRTVQGKYN